MMIDAAGQKVFFCFDFWPYGDYVAFLLFATFILKNSFVSFLCIIKLHEHVSLVNSSLPSPSFALNVLAKLTDSFSLFLRVRF